MRNFSLIIGFVLTGLFGFCRSNQPDSTIAKNQSQHIVKWGPLHVLNFYQTVQLGYEYRWRSNYSMQVEGGYVFSLGNTNQRFMNKRGVKIKTEARYYLDGYLSPKNHYVAFEPYLNMINFDRETTQIECFDLDCTILFSHTYTYKVKYREGGFSLKYGMTKEKGRFLLDLNLGLTLRIVNYKKPDITSGFDGDNEWSWLSIPNERKRVTIGPNLGVRIGYRLK